MRLKYVSIKLIDGVTRRRQISVSSLSIMELICLKEEKNRCKGGGRGRKRGKQGEGGEGKEVEEGNGEEGRETGRGGRKRRKSRWI